MKYSELLFEKVNEYQVKLVDKSYLIDLKKKDNRFTGINLKHLISDLKYIINKKNHINTMLIIDFGKITFCDKVTYLILDVILHYFLKNYKGYIKIGLDIEREKTVNKGFEATALFNSFTNSRFDKNKFIDFYEKEYTNQNGIYRRFIYSEKLGGGNRYPSIVGSDIATILEFELIENGLLNNDEDEDWIDSISEVTSELVDNISAHTDGDCLISVDINKDVICSDKKDKKFIFINIGILNLSEDRLFDKVKKNIQEKIFDYENNVYKSVYKAYDNHKSFFNNRYTEDDFFLVTAFQNRVTTRSVKAGSSGTGLTRLIEKIIGKTDDTYSYVLSGKNIIFFKSDYLGICEFEGMKMIGFNEENDYIGARPSKNIISKSELYIPGCAYNLMLLKEIE